MASPTRSGLLARIAIPINLASILVLSTFGYLIARSNAVSVRNAMESKIEFTARFLATSSASYVRNFDVYTLQGLAREAAKDADIQSITFMKDGKVFVEERDPPGSGTSGGSAEIVRDIRLGDETIGQVKIG